MNMNPTTAVRTTHHHQRCNVTLHLYRKRTSMPYEHHGSDATGLEYLEGLYSYAMILSRNHAEAEDLVQETYIRAMQAMRRLRADSNVKGWLFTILRNIWFNQLRKRRNGPQMVEIEAEDGVANSI